MKGIKKMIDWGLAESLIIFAMFIFLIIIGAITTKVIELYNRFKNYERPMQKISSKKWNFPEDDWIERIMKD